MHLSETTVQGPLVTRTSPVGVEVGGALVGVVGDLVGTALASIPQISVAMAPNEL